MIKEQVLYTSLWSRLWKEVPDQEVNAVGCFFQRNSLAGVLGVPLSCSPFIALGSPSMWGTDLKMCSFGEAEGELQSNSFLSLFKFFSFFILAPFPLFMGPLMTTLPAAFLHPCRLGKMGTILCIFGVVSLTGCGGEVFVTNPAFLGGFMCGTAHVAGGKEKVLESLKCVQMRALMGVLGWTEEVM